MDAALLADQLRHAQAYCWLTIAVLEVRWIPRSLANAFLSLHTMRRCSHSLCFFFLVSLSDLRIGFFFSFFSFPCFLFLPRNSQPHVHSNRPFMQCEEIIRPDSPSRALVAVLASRVVFFGKRGKTHEQCTNCELASPEKVLPSAPVRTTISIFENSEEEGINICICGKPHVLRTSISKSWLLC